MAFIDTVDYIVTTALRNVRAIPPIGIVPASQLTEMKSVALDVLNSVVQSLQSEDIYLWNSNEVTVQLSQGQSLVTSQTDILHAYGFIVTYEGTDYSLQEMSVDDYSALPDKSSAGVPSSYVLQVKPSFYSITLYPVPASAAVLKFVTVTPHPRYSLTTDLHNFPVYWTDALVWALSSELAGMYDLPVDERVLIERKASAKLSSAISYKASHSGSMFIRPARR